MRRFIYEMTIRRMLRHGLAARVPRGLYELATRRMTVDRISEYLFLAMRMRFGVVVSNTAAFSADVDTPHDAERFGEILRNR